VGTTTGRLDDVFREDGTDMVVVEVNSVATRPRRATRSPMA
jgi:hypothetical protein